MSGGEEREEGPENPENPEGPGFGGGGEEEREERAEKREGKGKGKGGDGSGSHDRGNGNGNGNGNGKSSAGERGGSGEGESPGVGDDGDAKSSAGERGGSGEEEWPGDGGNGKSSAGPDAAGPGGGAPGSRVWRRLRAHRGVRVGVVIALAWVLLAALATPLSGFHPDRFDADVALDHQTVPPFWLGPAPSLPPGAAPARYLLGTDDLGKDVFGLVLHGARRSLVIGLVAVGISLLLGVPLGLLSGYFGGRTDQAIMRALDVVMAFPTILLAICIVAVLGQSLVNLMVAVGLVGIPQITRQLRAQVLVVRELDYVQAARALGLGHARILARHVLPNCLGPIVVLATLGTATAILETAGLGFVGLGPEAGTPEWGLMIAENRGLIRRAPWAVLAPGLAIVTLVLGLNLLGDGLRDVLDPRQRVGGKARPAG